MRKTKRDIQELLLRAPDGHVFPLERVAQITSEIGQPEITREDLRPMVAVTGRIEGRDLGSTIADVQAALGRADLIPPGVTYELGGLYQQQRIAFRGLLMVMIAAVLLVFVLLLFLYERFKIALAMTAVMLLAIACVMIGLFLTKTELNITSIMGMTMIVGIVTEVAIFYSTEYAQTPPDISHHDRLIAAGNRRSGDRDDHHRGHSRAAAAGVGHRRRLGHAATAGHRDHRGIDCANAAGTDRDARVAGFVRRRPRVNLRVKKHRN